jgi:hypothetical protein
MLKSAKWNRLLAGQASLLPSGPKTDRKSEVVLQDLTADNPIIVDSQVVMSFGRSYNPTTANQLTGAVGLSYLNLSCNFPQPKEMRSNI